MITEAVEDLVDHPAAAIGVTGDYLDRAEALVMSGAKILCVDVAHGHHSMMRDALKHLKGEYGGDTHIMAGNVATGQGSLDLASWGADSIRVGIGGGIPDRGARRRGGDAEQAMGVDRLERWLHRVDT